MDHRFFYRIFIISITFYSFIIPLNADIISEMQGTLPLGIVGVGSDLISSSDSGYDIIGTKIVNPDHMMTGKSYTIQDFIQNRGSESAAAFTIRYSLSPDNLSSSGAIPIGTWNIDGLKPSSQKTGTIAVTIPPDMQPGSYYVVRMIDQEGTLTEEDIKNNIGFSRKPIVITKNQGNDSGIISIGTLLQDTIPAGGLLNVTSIFENTRQTPSEPFSIRYYLSNSDKFTNDSIQIGETKIPSIPGGEENEVNGVYLVPAETSKGKYYFFTSTLSSHGNTPDNVWQNQDPITITGSLASGPVSSGPSGTSQKIPAQPSGADIAGPDIISQGTDFPSTAFISGEFRITDSVQNNGGAKASIVNVDFYLSPDSNGGDRNSVGSWSMFDLMPGESRNKQVSLGVPTNVRPGVYFLVKQIKTTSNPPETETANNLWISNTPMTIRYDPSAPIPDLTHVKTKFPCGQPGNTVEITDTITNTGNACSGPFVVAYYFSPYAKFDGGTAQLLGQWNVDQICVGEQKTNTVRVTIPKDITNGEYYFYSVIDPCSFISECNGGLPELDKSNNINAGTLTIGPCVFCGC